jgi:hypothetical protein
MCVRVRVRVVVMVVGDDSGHVHTPGVDGDVSGSG